MIKTNSAFSKLHFHKCSFENVQTTFSQIKFKFAKA